MKPRKLGYLRFKDVAESLGDEIAFFVAEATGESEEDARVALDNGSVLPAYEIDLKSLRGRYLNPAEWKRSSTPASWDKAVIVFAKLMKQGVKFPPILVKKSWKYGLELLDGWHRAHAAILIGRKRINAIDLTAPRIVKMPEGHEIYVFGGDKV
jgi:hypothetical protein